MCTLKQLILPLLTVLACTSCQEVIDINLNETNPRYVIEGTVNNTGDVATVRISQTKNFSDNNSFVGVTQARVTIAEGEGEPAPLAEVAPGVYQSAQPMGRSGKTYQLRVEIGTEVFSGTSTMPQQVPFDSLYIKREIFPGQTYIMPYAKYHDPQGMSNYYRYRLFVNGQFIKMVNVDNDEYTDGLTVNRAIFYFGNVDNANTSDDEGILDGDEVTLEMQCIDKTTYDYFFTLMQTMEQSSASPANPVSNLTGGALGYFSAYTVQQKTLTVPHE